MSEPKVHMKFKCAWKYMKKVFSLQSNVLTLVESLVTHIQDAVPTKGMTRIQ